jgi:Xaa-Pro aminopeptidase
MSDEDILIVGDAEHCADLRYAVDLCVGEPFAYLRVRGRDYVLLPDAAVARARRCVRRCRVLSLARFQPGDRPAGLLDGALATAIGRLAREKRSRRLMVPPGFPLGLARELRGLKVRLKPRPGDLFFRERTVKSTAEVARIRAALVMAEVGLAEGIQALKTSKAGPRGHLNYRGSPLTVERLCAVIQVAVLQSGGQAQDTTITGGVRPAMQAGVLRANQPIVIALTPRSEKTGYHAGLARTVVRGRATEPVRRLYATVQRGQAEAFNRLCEGVAAGDVPAAVEACFVREGFRSTRRNGVRHGFDGETGHGIGLDPREPPYLVAGSRSVLQAGNVLAVGLRLGYPELGHVHLEDLALLTANGARNLTQFEKVLEV